LKRRNILVLVLLAVAALAWFIWRLYSPDEPVYQGKRLRAWLDEAYRTRDLQALTNAVRQMGTNALPALLRMVRLRDGWLVQQIEFLPNSRDMLPERLARDYHTMAVWGFNALGPTAGPAVPALIALLDNRDTAVRATAAACLRASAPEAQETVPVWIRCLSDLVKRADFAGGDGAALAVNAAMALSTFGPAAKEAIPILSAVTNGPTWWVGNAAQFALMRINGDSVLPLIDQLSHTSAPDEWYHRADLVSDFGTEAEPAIPLLLAVLGSTNDLISLSSAYALGKIHQQAEFCVPALIPLLNSTNANTRRAALGALGQFGRAATSAVPAIVPCLYDYHLGVSWGATNILKTLDALPRQRLKQSPNLFRRNTVPFLTGETAHLTVVDRCGCSETLAAKCNHNLFQ